MVVGIILVCPWFVRAIYEAMSSKVHILAAVDQLSVERVSSVLKNTFMFLQLVKSVPKGEQKTEWQLRSSDRLTRFDRLDAMVDS